MLSKPELLFSVISRRNFFAEMAERVKSKNVVWKMMFSQKDTVKFVLQTVLLLVKNKTKLLERRYQN